MTNLYKILKNKQEKEFNEFPMKFAFDNKQFEQAMKELGLKATDTDKVYSGFGGGFYLKTDAPRLHEMLTRFDKEMETAIKADPTGTGFVYDMFYYELCNHEYCITWEVDDTLDALGLTMEEINASEALSYGLKQARIEAGKDE